MENENRFKIGDVVKLKSDGPSMTVVDYNEAASFIDKNKESEKQVETKWFNGKKCENGIFPESALNLVEK